MFNRRWPAVIALSSLSLTVVFSFQNCAEMHTIQDEGTLDTSSMSGGMIDLVHQDNDHSSYEVAEKPIMQFDAALMDRTMVYNVMVDVFGPRASGLGDSTRLATDFIAFGAGCSLNDTYRNLEGKVQGRPGEACALDVQRMGASLQPKMQVLRASLIEKACRTLSDDATAFTYVMKQIKGTESGVLPQLNEANILDLFYLFYRAKPRPQQSLIDSLDILVRSTSEELKSDTEGWRRALYTVCASGYWQVL